jgi:hypothetical protein
MWDVESAWEQAKPKAVFSEMLENAMGSVSYVGARGVGPFLTIRLLWI